MTSSTTPEAPPLDFENFHTQAALARAQDCQAFLAAVRDYWGPTSLEALVTRAQWLHRTGDFAEALSVCQAITHDYPAYSNHRYILADVCAHLGQSATALAALERFGEGRTAPEARLHAFEVRHALGCDDDIIADRDPFDLSQINDLLAKTIQGQSRMRRDGLAAGLSDYARAWTDRRAKAIIYGATDILDDPRMWRPEEGLPEALMVFRRGGVGDTIQWLRYLPYLRAIGVEARLAEEDDPISGLSLSALAPGDGESADNAHRLADLTGGRSAAAVQTTEPFELFTALFSRLGYGDRPGGYLRPNPDDRALALLADAKAMAQGRPLIGLFWSANESHHTFANKSLTLGQIEPLLARRDICWVVFQRGHEMSAWRRRGESGLTVNLPADFTFGQAGGVAAGLDAMITVDSALAHLSGALGRPTFLLASAAADWRWEAAPHTTPWYQTLDIARQPRLGDWPGALQVLKDRLDAWLSGQKALAPVPGRPI